MTSLLTTKVQTFDLSMGLKGAIEISNASVEQSHNEVYAQFIHPPWEDNPPLVQGVLIRGETSRELISTEDLFEMGFENPKSIDSYKLSLLNNYIELSADSVKFINFLKPFDKLFAYGSKFINIMHPSGQELLRFICATKSENLCANLPRDAIGKLDDLIEKFFNSSIYFNSKIIDCDYLIENEEDVNYLLREEFGALQRRLNYLP